MFRRSSAAPAATPPPSTTQGPSQSEKAAAQRSEFSRYVLDISRTQRAKVADRIDTIAKHKVLDWQYFVGAELGTVAVVLTAFRLWGPRHLFSNPMYYARPIPPALAMGMVTYGLLYNCRLMIMRGRLVNLIEDFEYELKRVRANHVEEGITQLAWLQFVAEQMRLGHEEKMDIAKMRTV